jgi:class 3 adenylate cyclase/tetratricopeptide (TPR) repeat protein
VQSAERKVVTVLFCDLVESTRLGETVDAEVLQSVQKTYFDRMRTVVEEFGGTIEKFIGDAVVAVFGVPQTREDDAARAVRCALSMHDAIAELNETRGPLLGIELEVRVGLDTGEAVISLGHEALATGEVMSTAARLQQAAAPGQILAGRATSLLTKDVVYYAERSLIEAKGQAQPLEAWRPVGVAEERRRRRSPFVGRKHELALLSTAADLVLQGDGPRVVVLLGEPGIGKSRFAEEFGARSSPRLAFYRAALKPYGEGGTWQPFTTIIEAEVGLRSRSAPDATAALHERLRRRHEPDEASVLVTQLQSLVGELRSSAASGSEIVWAVRRYLEGLAAEQPSAIVLDDLHWATDDSVQALEEIMETIASGSRLLFLCQGRLELRERLGTMLAGPRTTMVELGGLADAEGRMLIAKILGSPTEEAGARIAARAAGNPLFLEELAAIADEARGPELPQTLRTLIAARLDLLPADAKHVAQAAAVVGEPFWDDSVLTQLPDSTDVAGSLRILRGRGLVEEARTSAFLGRREFRFHHDVIREVAYDALPKRERVVRHRAVAAWLESLFEGHHELSVSIARHHEHALALLAELAPLEPVEPGALEAAVSALVRAAEWSASSAALTEAVDLLRRAAELAHEDRALESVVQSRLAVALAQGGHVDDAVASAQEALQGTPTADACALASLALAHAAEERGDWEGIREHAPTAIRRAREAGVPRIEGEALELLGWASFWRSEDEEAEQTWGRVAELSLAAGETAAAGRALGYQSLSATFQGELTRAEALAEEAMRVASESGSLRALISAQTALARAREYQDRPEEAVEHGREWLRLTLELGDRLRAVAACAFGLADPLLRLGRLEEAWEELERGLEISTAMGGSAYDHPIAMRRVEVRRRQGRLDEAEAEMLRARRTRIRATSSTEHRSWRRSSPPVAERPRLSISGRRRSSWRRPSRASPTWNCCSASPTICSSVAVPTQPPSFSRSSSR